MALRRAGRVFSLLAGALILAAPVGASGGSAGTLSFPDAEVAPAREVRLRIIPPEGFVLNEAAPSRVSLSDPAGRVVRTWRTKQLRGLELAIGAHPASAASWLLEARIFLCRKGDAAICMVRRASQRFRPVVGAQASVLEWRIGDRQESISSDARSRLKSE